MKTTFVVLISDERITKIEADEYRIADGDLYLYQDERDDPVATFYEMRWDGIYRQECGNTK